MRVTLAILFAVALAANLDRFLQGPEGLLRAHDVADNTVTGLASCGQFWHSALQSTWDPTRLRGWPRAGSPQHPQLFMCMAAAAVPPAYLLPILHALLLCLIAVGTYLFVSEFLARSHEAAVSGALVNLSLYFFFHEHPVVPSAILLPPLIGFLAVPVQALGDRVLMWIGAALVLGLSNPPPTLLLMPLGHLALLAAAPRADRRRHFIRCAGFWTLYGVYYAPTMLAMLREYADSSRSLYKPSVIGGTFVEIFRERLFNPAIITPGVVLLTLVSRRTWRATLLVVLGIVGFVALTASNELLVRDFGRRLPFLMSLSTTYYRMYYFVPIAVLLAGTWLIDDVSAEPARARTARAAAAALLCAGIYYGTQGWGRVFYPFWQYAAVIGAVALSARWWTRRAWATALIVIAVVAFGRFQFSRVYEVPNEGNLFVEPPAFNQPAVTGRTVTVMEDCDAVDLFPEQARAAGVDIIDGISNYYSRRFVERWRYYVADNPTTCTSRYATWSTRTELTQADLAYSADRVLAWLWINNVTLLRSAQPLVHPSLTLVNHAAFKVDGTHRVQRYLYRLTPPPVGDVFTIPAALATRASGDDLTGEEDVLHELQHEGRVTPVAVERVSGSHLRFDGDFAQSVAVIANVNYHRGWHVLIDGEPAARAASEGPFGMIRVPAAPGHHRYDLIFSSPYTPFVPILMAAALALLWVGAGTLDRAERILPDPPIRLRWIVAAGVCGAVVLMAATLWQTRPAPARWIDGGWTGRLALETSGVPITAALSRFPVRIELGPDDAAFWESAGAAGPNIRVTDDRGTVLPMEIESYEPARKRLVVWAQIPRLAPGAQSIGYLYFGGDAAAPPPAGPRVWDSAFSRVWTTVPSSDEAAEFPAGRDRWTLEFRVFPEPVNGRNFELIQAGPPGAFNVYLHNSGYIVVERQNGDRLSEIAFAEQKIVPSKWTHVALSRTRDHLRLALDGRPVAAHLVTPTFPDPVLSGVLRFGAGRYDPLAGRLTDIRLSPSVARSADWELATAASLGPGFVRVTASERRSSEHAP